MTNMKPITAWMINLHSHLVAHASIIIGGFCHTGIVGCIKQL